MKQGVSGAAVLGMLNGLALLEKSAVHSLSVNPGESGSRSEYTSKLYNIIERYTLYIYY